MTIQTKIAFALLIGFLIASLLYALIRVNVPAQKTPKKFSIGYPKSRREIVETFCWIATYAPNLPNDASLDEELKALKYGLSTLAPRLRIEQTKLLHQKSLQQLEEAIELFKNNEVLDGVSKLQDSEASYRKLQRAGLSREAWEDF